MVRNTILFLLVAAAFCGCRAMPPPEPGPPPIPAVKTSVSYFHGSPLSGPLTPEEVPEPQEQVSEVAVSFAVLDDLPEECLGPLANRTRLIAASRGAEPLRPSPYFCLGSRAGTLTDAASFLAELEAEALGRSALVTRLRGRHPPGGVTAVFRVEDSEAIGESIQGKPLRRSVEIQVHCKGDKAASLQVALVIENLMERESGEGEARPAFQREAVLLDEDLGSLENPIALIVPSPFTSSPARALVAVLETTDFLGIKRVQAPEEILAQPENVIEFQPTESHWWQGIQQVLEGLEWPYHQRQTLLYLAGVTNACLTEDLALSATDPIVNQLALSVLDKVKEIALTDPALLGWVIESCAYKLLAKQWSEQGLSALVHKFGDVFF